jgi:hypothetical protein
LSSLFVAGFGPFLRGFRFFLRGFTCFLRGAVFHPRAFLSLSLENNSLREREKERSREDGMGSKLVRGF